MNAINLYLTIPEHHTITLPAELTTGSQAHIIILTENALPTARPLAFLQRLKQRRAARPQPTTSTSTQASIDTYIEACRNDWND